jgi:hypothetical protein
MKQLMAAGTVFLTLIGAQSIAGAAPIFDFTYTGSLVTFTVPATGNYQILAFGAQGGNSEPMGGLGAEIGGTFSLTADVILQIAVGGAGRSGFGGGGGQLRSWP